MVSNLVLVKDTSKTKAIYRCVCGVEKEFYKSNVLSFKSKSCGCINKLKVPKYISRTFTLISYRCNTPTSSDYSNYGGRGIKLLYKDYNEFYKDIGERPTPKHTVDRIDVNKHYEVGNCRWATYKEQSINKRSNRLIEYNGKIQTLSEWAIEYNIGYTTLRERLRKLSIEEALVKEIDEKHSYAGKSKAKKLLS